MSKYSVLQINNYLFVIEGENLVTGNRLWLYRRSRANIRR